MNNFHNIWSWSIEEKVEGKSLLGAEALLALVLLRHGGHSLLLKDLMLGLNFFLGWSGFKDWEVTVLLFLLAELKFLNNWF